MRPAVIDLVAGARPNFMKVAPILRAMRLGRAGRMGVSGMVVRHVDRPQPGEQLARTSAPRPGRSWRAALRSWESSRCCARRRIIPLTEAGAMASRCAISSVPAGFPARSSS